jgi:hypothetical protein
VQGQEGRRAEKLHPRAAPEEIDLTAHSPDRKEAAAAARASLPFLFGGTPGGRPPELALQKGVLQLSLHNERLAAGVVAIAVAWRWRLTFVTIASGLFALHLFDRLL